jgi:hypothetical protein
VVGWVVRAFPILANWALKALFWSLLAVAGRPYWTLSQVEGLRAEMDASEKRYSLVRADARPQPISTLEYITSIVQHVLYD